VKKILILILLLLAGFTATPQKLANGIYWFYLKDKEGNSYNIAEPELFLSQRSLERRGWQGLPVDERDLPLAQRYLDSLQEKGIRIVQQSRWLNGVALELPDGITEADVKNYSFISALPWQADPENIYLTTKPEGERFSPPMPVGFSYGMADAQVRQTGLPALHEYGYTGRGVVIAVLDAGFFATDKLPAFDSLFATGRILRTRDFVTPGGNVYSQHTHGMNVLSIIGGNIPGILVGTAPHASFILCRTEDGNSELKIEEVNWIAAAEWADSLGADILNTSLGYSVFDDSLMNYSYEDMNGERTLISRAAGLVAGRGMVLCVSAGNEGAKDWYYISAPADAKEVLTVGAIDSLGVLASFSSHGPTYDNRIKPDVVAMGYQTAVQHTDSTIRRGNGTSFSAPVMSGATACFWPLYPDMPASQLIRTITGLSDRANDPDINYGFGLPDLSAAILSAPALQIEKSGITLYPNPCHGSFRYTLTDSRNEGTDRIRVFDISGRLCLDAEGSQDEPFVLPDAFAGGIYLIEISTPTGRFTGRLLLL